MIYSSQLLWLFLYWSGSNTTLYTEALLLLRHTLGPLLVSSFVKKKRKLTTLSNQMSDRFESTYRRALFKSPCFQKVVA